MSETTLRRCHDCGLEAKTEKDLEKFVYQPFMNYKRRNLCKGCQNKRRRLARQTNDAVYLRNVWGNMIQRCHNKNNPSYGRYGNKDITVCDEWRGSSKKFIEWALNNGFERHLQTDRIDNNKGYSPENCRWVTPSQNCRNKNNNRTNYVKKTRICRVCNVEKPLDNYHKSKNRSLGRIYICKSCKSSIKKAERLMKRWRMIKDEPLRTCRVCGLEAWDDIGLGFFVKYSKNPHGRRTLCKKCHNQHQNAMYRKNKGYR